MIGWIIGASIFLVLFGIDGGFTDMRDLFLWIRSKLPGPDRDQALGARRAFEHQVIKTSLSLEGTPEHQIIAWTPAEREAFGINDTMRFIEETDKILNPKPKPITPGGYAPAPTKIAAGVVKTDTITTGTFNIGEYRRALGIDEPVVELHAWGQEKPVRVLEPEFEHQFDRSGRIWHATTFHKPSGLAVSHPVSHELALVEGELSRVFKLQREEIREQLSPTVTGGRVFG